MNEEEKNRKIEKLIEKFKQEINNIPEEKQQFKIGGRLDNGKTMYTEIYNKYKKEIDEIKRK